MYGSTTRLVLKSAEDLRAVVDGLEQVLCEARAVDGFRECYVLQTATDELTMVTIYDSEAASTAASAQLRPKLAESVGPHVAGPPERSAGNVLAAASRVAS